MKVKLPVLPRSLQEHNCPLQTMGVNKSIVNVNNMIVPSMNKFYNHVINVDKKIKTIDAATENAFVLSHKSFHIVD